MAHSKRNHTKHMNSTCTTLTGNHVNGAPEPVLRRGSDDYIVPLETKAGF